MTFLYRFHMYAVQNTAQFVDTFSRTLLPYPSPSPSLLLRPQMEIFNQGFVSTTYVRFTSSPRSESRFPSVLIASQGLGKSNLVVVHVVSIQLVRVVRAFVTLNLNQDSLLPFLSFSRLRSSELLNPYSFFIPTIISISHYLFVRTSAQSSRAQP